jgi:hypothetical protein
MLYFRFLISFAFHMPDKQEHLSPGAKNMMRAQRKPSLPGNLEVIAS